MNWLDILVIVILILNIGIGWFRGFIRSVTNIISIVLGFVLAKIYYVEVYNYLIEKFNLFDKIKESVKDNFSNIEFPEVTEMADMSSSELSNLVGNSNYSQLITEKFFDSELFSKLMQNNVNDFSESFSTWLSDSILTIISMIVIFIVVYLGVRFIGFLLNKIFKLPVLNGVNKLSGLLFGFAKGCFFSMLIVLLIVTVGPIFSDLNIIELLEKSDVAIYFYKYNIVMFIFELII